MAGLIDLGWECDDVTAYRTVRAAPPPAPTRDAIKAGKFDAVVFTSSSTVRNLVGIAGKPHPSTVIAVIGPATAKTAEEHGLRVDVMAPKPRRRGARRRARRLRRRPAAGDGGGRPAGRQAVGAQASGAAQGRARSSRWPTSREAARSPTARPPAPAAHARRPCAGWSPRRASRPRQLVLPLFVREGVDRAGPDHVDAGRRPAHPRLAAQGGARGGRAGARRGDAVRRPESQGRHRLGRASTPPASSTSRSPTSSPRSATR